MATYKYCEKKTNKHFTEMGIYNIKVKSFFYTYFKNWAYIIKTITFYNWQLIFSEHCCCKWFLKMRTFVLMMLKYRNTHTSLTFIFMKIHFQNFTKFSVYLEFVLSVSTFKLVTIHPIHDLWYHKQKKKKKVKIPKSSTCYNVCICTILSKSFS